MQFVQGETMEEPNELVLKEWLEAAVSRGKWVLSIFFV